MIRAFENTFKFIVKNSINIIAKLLSLNAQLNNQSCT